MTYLYNIWKGIGSNFLTDNSSKFSFRLAIGDIPVLKDNVSVYSFALDIVWVADNGRLCYRRMLALSKTSQYQITLI